MPTYDLSGLGASEFEMLCVALARQVFQSEVRVLGVGFQVSLDYSRAGSERRWEGIGSLVVKYRGPRGGGASNIRWFERTIKRELDLLTLAREYDLEGADPPDYLMLATNVVVSEGGKPPASVDALIKSYIGQAFRKDWDIWDAGRISTFLDEFTDVRYGFLLGLDYVANSVLTDGLQGLASFTFSPLGQIPSGCPEVIAAWWRLNAAHEAVSGLFRASYLLRQNTLLRSDESATERLAEGVQDLLRSAIVFTSAGVDACLESLLGHAVPVLATHNDGASGKFERYIENQANAPKVNASFVAALKSPDPRARLIQLYILSLAKGSFQGSESIKDRGLAALGVTNEQLPSIRLTALDPFFVARNDVVHRLDLVQPPTPAVRPSRQARRLDEVGRMCDDALLVMRDLIYATAENIGKSRATES